MPVYSNQLDFRLHWSTNDGCEAVRHKFHHLKGDPLPPRLDLLVCSGQVTEVVSFSPCLSTVVVNSNSYIPQEGGEKKNLDFADSI